MIHVGGGFPSVEKTAATFGISKSRVRWLTALLDEIEQGRANSPRRIRKAKMAGLSTRYARVGRSPVAASKSRAASRAKVSRRKKTARRRRRTL